MNKDSQPSPCHYCGNPDVQYLELVPDYRDCHGPGGFSTFYITCPDCGLRGGSASLVDVPAPQVTRKYKVKTWMGTFPVEDYAPQDTDAEIRRVAVAKWNAMPNRYRGNR
jgi:hypothetical protein